METEREVVMRKRPSEMKVSASFPIRCYQRSVSPRQVQEWYETNSGDARRRAAQLRRFKELKVTTQATGPQVTRVGRVKMSLVTIRLKYEFDEWPEIPEVIVEKL